MLALESYLLRVNRVMPERSPELNPDALVWYLVERPDGPAGVVDDWILSDDGTPTAMIVSQGWFGRRHYEVAMSDVIGIDRGRRQIFVYSRASVPRAEGWLERTIKLLPRRRIEQAETDRLFFLCEISEAIDALGRWEHKVDGFELELARRARELREGAEKLAAEVERIAARR